MPAVALKAAAVRGALMIKKKMTDARIFMYVIPDEGDLIKMDFAPPTFRIEGVRNKDGNLVPRLSAEFNSWKATFRVRYLGSMVSADEMIAIFDTAGQFVGLFAARPFGYRSTGTFGTFEIVNATQSQK